MIKLCECPKLSDCYGGIVDEVRCTRDLLTPRGAEQDREQVAMAREIGEMHEIKQTLIERGKRYGDFSTHAEIAQGLQTYMRARPGWVRLTDDKKQALTVIVDKIARILNGDPEYTDNWHDIGGYAKLAEERCKAEDPARSSPAPADR